MAVASIKGIAVRAVVNALGEMLADGRLTREELESRLDADDLKLLEEEVVPGLWYPIASFIRMLDLALEKAAVTEPRQLVETGFGAAEALLSGSAHEGLIANASKFAQRPGIALIRLAPLLVNFSRWSIAYDPVDEFSFEIEVEEASELTDTLRFLAQGVIQYLAERVRGEPRRVTSERPSSDRIRFEVRPGA